MLTEQSKQSGLNALNSIVNTINSSMDLDLILDLILDTAIEIMNAERGFIMMLDSRENELVFKTARNIDKTTLWSDNFLISRTIINDVVMNQKGILSHNAAEDPRYMGTPSVVQFGLRSIIAAPLKVKGTCNGAIYLDNRFKHGIFNEDDFNFMTVFAHEVAIAMENARLENEKNYIHEILKQYVSPDVADEIIKNGLDIDLMGENRDITVLFVDIRGFTTLSETEAPHKLVSQLNEFFKAVSGIIFSKRGTVFKFLGDGMMAGWGAPVEDPQKNEHALSAGLEILSLISSMNNRWHEKNKPCFKIGIGIHSGTAMTGIIGCSRRKEYSILGDVVNTASRLESLNKEYGSEMIVSESALKGTSLAVFFERIGNVTLRGKKESICVYKACK